MKLQLISVLKETGNPMRIDLRLILTSVLQLREDHYGFFRMDLRSISTRVLVELHEEHCGCRGIDLRFFFY